jgi:hypothetical protein
MLHVLIALKTILYLQANNDVIGAGQILTSYLQAKFFLSSQCCKADCLENTVNFSGGTRPTFFSVLPATSCGTREPGLSKAPSRAASFAGASILLLRLHSTMVAGPHPAGADPPPAPAPAAVLPAKGRKGCCGARDGGCAGAKH